MATTLETNRVHRVAFRYAQLYKKLYNRDPKELRVLDNEFVLINETHIRLNDLIQLTKQLEQEYKAQQRKRSNILRLIDWFKKN